MNPQLIKQKLRFLNSKSEGSAIAEFLIFTLPFFSAILLITTTVYQQSIANSEAKNLARQSLRAFITSPNEELAQARADQVLQIYRDQITSTEQRKRNFKLQFQCSNNPCLSKGGLVSVQLTVSVGESVRKEIVSTASEYVDLWR